MFDFVTYAHSAQITRRCVQNYVVLAQLIVVQAKPLDTLTNVVCQKPKECKADCVACQTVFL